jgi:CBS domain-containing protein
VKKRPEIDPATLRKLRQKREALYGIESFPYGEELRSVMVAPVYTCQEGEPVREVVEEMSRRGVSCVVVVNELDGPVGIMTERDVMRRIVASGGAGKLDAAVSEVMTPGPVTLSPGDSVYRGLSVLYSMGIKHLPLVSGGRTAGIVTLRQLLKLRYPEPMIILEGIGSASGVRELRELKDRLPELSASKLGIGIMAPDVVAMISLINQDIHRRAFELVLGEMGPPPARYCLFLTGSHGRMENLLTADQDHGMVIEDGEGEQYGGYFMELARRFSEWLGEIGFATCPGYVMSVNPTWRKSLSEWKTQLEYWVERQVPNLARYVTVFFDSVPVYGDEGLFRELDSFAWSLLSEHYEVLRVLHEEEGGHRAPTGFLGRFITEREGEHRGELDIKKSGLIFVVEGTRILALLHGIRATPTLKRISGLVEGGFIHPYDGEYLESAFKLLLHFALSAQVWKAQAGAKPDTFISPKSLSPRDREMLRHAFRAVSTLKDIIATEFGELVL